MVKSVVLKEEWAEIAPSYKVEDKQYYYLRVNPIEEEGYILSVQQTLDHYPTEEDKSALYNNWVNTLKSNKKVKATEYAGTSEIKQFTINGISGWLNSDERVSIRKAAQDKAAAGRTTYTLYLNGVGFDLTPSKVEYILSLVEVYASDCFDITEKHKQYIDALSTVEEVNVFDVTSGYPDKLVFNLEGELV